MSPLLPALPERFDYRVILMQRDLDQVLSSQAAMMQTLEASAPVDSNGSQPSGDTKLARAFRNENEKIESWLNAQANIRTCYVSHRDVLGNPLDASRALARFLEEMGSPMIGEAASERMAAVVDARLHHHR